MSHIYNQQLPSVRDANYNHQNFVDYLKPIHIKNKNSSFAVIQYTNNITLNAPVYAGGIYSPYQNRIYFTPYTDATNS